MPDDDRYWHDVLIAADEGLTDEDRRDYEAMAAAVGPFLDVRHAQTHLPSVWTLDGVVCPNDATRPFHQSVISLPFTLFSPVRACFWRAPSG